jgi:tRNA pseudouridine38/39 synthase
MTDRPNYEVWARKSLIERIKQLESEVIQHRYALETKSLNQRVELVASDSGPQKVKAQKEIDPNRYSTRFIALKFAYLGKSYGGFEFHSSAPLPTIEEVLWEALAKACLVFPADKNKIDFECCEYSKCGRTDRGVSAFGQVIGLRVRSNRPLPKQKIESVLHEMNPENPAQGEPSTEVEQPGEVSAEAEPSFDPIKDEIQYCRVLNRLLPNDIRVLAWCPAPPSDFSARFSCKERQYRYFFTQPVFSPMPSQLESSVGQPGLKDGWVSIEKMREGAKLFEGLHDFRNFCKIDSSKQITNFERRILEADIEEVKDIQSVLPYLGLPEMRPAALGDSLQTFPKVYSFNVRGTAFLWHQIRHMVSILFMIGQELESPSIITELLDVKKNPRKPSYTMADETPLVLWDCVFDDPETNNPMEWLFVGDDAPLSKYAWGGLMNSLWSNWRGSKMDEILANQLLQHVSCQGDLQKGLQSSSVKAPANKVVFEGGNSGRQAGSHIPIMKRKLAHSPEEANDIWARRKGFANAAEMKAQQDWRQAIKEGKSTQDTSGTA